jgi:hypothetical protein
MAAITGAVLGLATTAVSIGMNVSAANKAASERAKAQKAAEKAIEEAKKEISRMPMQELSLNLDVYKQAQEAQNVAAATAIDAAQQGQGRGLAAAVGRTQMANIEGQQGVRSTQASEMLSLDKVKAKERQEASNALKDLGISEAEGAQAAAADAAARQAQATQQAIVSGAEGIKGAMNLYNSVQGPFDPTSVGMQTDETFKKLGEGGILAGLQTGNYGTGWEELNGQALRSWMETNLTVDQLKDIRNI